MTSTTSADSTNYHKKHQRKRKRSILTIVLVGLVLASTIVLIMRSQRVIVPYWPGGGASADGWGGWNEAEQFFGAAVEALTTSAARTRSNEDLDEDEDGDLDEDGDDASSITKNHVDPGGNVEDPQRQEGQKKQQGAGERELPYLVMFVGPMKTASTTLQAALAILEQKGVLAKDNYVFLGRRRRPRGGRPIWDPMLESMIPQERRAMHPYLKHCPNQNYTDCWNKAGAPQTIQKLAVEQRANVIIYEEYLLDGIPLALNATFQRAIEGKFQLIVVVGYRRLFSWLPSWKNQMEKYGISQWPEARADDDDDDEDPTQTNSHNNARNIMKELASNRKRTLRSPPFFRVQAHAPAENHHGWTVDVINNYKSWNDHSNIRIFNMHHHEDGFGGDVISHFLCDILPQSNHSCAAASSVARELKGSEDLQNPSVNVDISLIAVEAMDRDLLFLDPTTKRLPPRRQVEDRIRKICYQTYADQKKKKEDSSNAKNETSSSFSSSSSLPMECLDLESQKVLLEKSIRIERELVANFSDTSPHLKEWFQRRPRRGRPRQQQEEDEDEEERHRQSFWKSTHKFCSVNLTAIFADPLWLGCLARINEIRIVGNRSNTNFKNVTARTQN